MTSEIPMSRMVWSHLSKCHWPCHQHWFKTSQDAR